MVEKKKTVIEHNIVVGTLATGWHWTDKHPFEVIKVSPSGKTITVREMDATPDKANGYDYFGNQVYIYESNEKARITTVRFTKYGWKAANGMKFAFGYARKYQDPHF